MHSEEEPTQAAIRRKAGHFEILGETVAKFEFFEKGWNPYSRFLDIDKVDLILRRKASGRTIYREVQVKFGKLHESKGWERNFFDVTSWRFFNENEFEGQLDQKDFFIAYVLSRDDGYRSDIFIFPIRDFVKEVIHSAIPRANGKREVLISKTKDGSERWVVRRGNRFTEINDQTCVDVSSYRRNFELLE